MIATIVAVVDIVVFARSITSIVNLRIVNSVDVVFFLAIVGIAHMYGKSYGKLASLTNRAEEKLLIDVGYTFTRIVEWFQVAALIVPLAVMLYNKWFAC